MGEVCDYISESFLVSQSFYSTSLDSQIFCTLSIEQEYYLPMHVSIVNAGISSTFWMLEKWESANICSFSSYLSSVVQSALSIPGRNDVSLYVKSTLHIQPGKSAEMKFRFLDILEDWYTEKGISLQQGHKETWESHLNSFRFNFVTCTVGMIIISSLWKELLRIKWTRKRLENYESRRNRNLNVCITPQDTPAL